MLSNPDQLKLVRLANLIGVGRMAFVGDARQLGAVDAGKPFSVMQQAGAPTAQMNQNLRARGDAIKLAAAAAQIGAVDRAMEALAPFTIEAPGRGSAEAAERWLALSEGGGWRHDRLRARLVQRMEALRCARRDGLV